MYLNQHEPQNSIGRTQKKLGEWYDRTGERKQHVIFDYEELNLITQ